MTLLFDHRENIGGEAREREESEKDRRVCKWKKSQKEKEKAQRDREIKEVQYGRM